MAARSSPSPPTSARARSWSPAREKAELLGIKPENIFIDDLREEFVRDFVFPMFRANAALRGPVPARHLDRPAADRQAPDRDRPRRSAPTRSRHGATGKGNDQVRFELGYYALKPDIKVIAPWREWDLDSSRTQLLEFAEKHQIPIAKDKRGEAPFSVDANLLHSSSEGKVLEDPCGRGRPSTSTSAPSRPRTRPTSRPYIDDRLREGRPGRDRRRGAVARRRCSTKLNELGGDNGIGRLDLVENRFVGMKSRGIYETPGGTILLAAHRGIEMHHARPRRRRTSRTS